MKFRFPDMWPQWGCNPQAENHYSRISSLLAAAETSELQVDQPGKTLVLAKGLHSWAQFLRRHLSLLLGKSCPIFDSDCPIWAHLLKAWSTVWCYWKEVELLIMCVYARARALAHTYMHKHACATVACMEVRGKLSEVNSFFPWTSGHQAWH